MELKVFCGRSNVPLAQAIGVELSRLVGDAVNVPCVADCFDDGEPKVRLTDNVRGADVYFIQSTHQPADNLLELLVMVDAARRASAASITAVMPYFGYGREDKKVKPRMPITARLVSDLLECAGANRVLTADLHAGQIQGFFRVPVDNLEAMPILLDEIRRKETDIDFHEAVFVSPDDGGVERCRETGKLVGCHRVTFILKYRDPESGQVTDYGAGDPAIVEGRDCFLIDDLVATAGSLEHGAAVLRQKARARRVFAACVHPVLATHRETGKRALARIQEAGIERLFTTDTIPLSGERAPQGAEAEMVRVSSVAGFIAEAINAVHRQGSVSEVIRRYHHETLER